MTEREFCKAAFDYAVAHGCMAAEAYVSNTRSFEVNASEQDIDRYNVSTRAGLNLRVQYGGRNGYAYTEKPDDPQALAQYAIDNAKAIEIADEHPMQGKCVYPEIQKPANPMLKLSNAEKIALALRMEEAALKADQRVVRVGYCVVAQEEETGMMLNTCGLDVEWENDIAYTILGPVAAENGEMKNAFVFRFRGEAMDVEATARTAVERTVAQFGAKPVASGKYQIVFRADAMADLLDTFSEMFSADAAQKGRSLLAEKVGQTVGAEIVNIRDNPLHPMLPRRFDAEGTPSSDKCVVENGVLTTLLHNLKTAKKAGVESTGNAVRASAASPVGVGTTVFYLEPGESSLDALLATMSSGILITELQGLHAGADSVSGNFSLSAAGFFVENGKVARPVNQITVAGNFLALLSDIRALGNDLEFSPSAVGAPSVLTGEMMVAGE